MNQEKKIVYVDMDEVIVDFQSGINSLSKEEQMEWKGKYDKYPGIFSKMVPIVGAIDAVYKLMEKYDVYILSSPSWENASSFSDKNLWVRKYFSDKLKKRLILSHHKNLNRGDYLIDDRTKNGADKFKGEHIHFGNDPKFQNWDDVLKYLLK
ncbi:hypothetical protein CSB11_00875 [Candidatus Campbellbacteria bacterium]|nr:MAG: hypothetical protein CSB11_00875 [Candidatus Campbellbacteria bacterium]